MKNHLPETTASFWLETGQTNSYPALLENLKVDIAVVGGGIAGVLTAHALAEDGKDVALFEARELLHGTTGYTTAKLSAQHQLVYHQLLKRYGKERAKLFYQANMEGIDYIREIADDLDIDCGFRERDAYVYTEHADKKELFEKEAGAYEQLNISGEYVDELPLDLSVAAGVKMTQQAEFQPVTFLHGVLEKNPKLQNAVYEQTLVKELKENEDETLELTTEKGYTIQCNQAIFATHFPTFEIDRHYEDNMDPEISYALAYEAEDVSIHGMYISADDPKKTFRKMTYNEQEYLLVGGQSHRLGDDSSEQSRYEEIDQFAKKVFGVNDPIYRWSSHDMITKDRVPFIGQLDPNYSQVYTQTGFSKWGLADAATGAKVLTDLINGRANKYRDMYHPHRDVPKLPEEEASSSDKNDTIEKLIYKESPEDLAPGEATIVDEGEENEFGVYKDTTGELHYLDLACTHVGCGVKWNTGDKTWDCPCHGSRFSATGRVIEGPAMEDLAIKNE